MEVTSSTAACEACPVELGQRNSQTCPWCGLWWVTGSTHTRWEGTPDTPSGPADALRLSLPSYRPPFGFTVFVVILAPFGWASAWTIVSGLADTPLSLQSLPFLVLSLPLAVLIGMWSVIVLAQTILHRLIPSRLQGEAGVLRLRLWRTWGGLLSGFRRTDVRISREHLVGLAVGFDQGRNAELFLIHSTGQHFYAGFTGDRQHLDKIATAIQPWLAEARAPGDPHVRRARA